MFVKHQGCALALMVQVGAVVGVEWYWNTLKHPNTILIVAVAVVVAMVHVLGHDPIQINSTEACMCKLLHVLRHMTTWGPLE